MWRARSTMSISSSSKNESSNLTGVRSCKQDTTTNREKQEEATTSAQSRDLEKRKHGQHVVLTDNGVEENQILSSCNACGPRTRHRHSQEPTLCVECAFAGNTAADQRPLVMLRVHREAQLLSAVQLTGGWSSSSHTGTRNPRSLPMTSNNHACFRPSTEVSQLTQSWSAIHLW